MICDQVENVAYTLRGKLHQMPACVKRAEFA